VSFVAPEWPPSIEYALEEERKMKARTLTT